MRHFSYDQGSIVFMNFSTEKVYQSSTAGVPKLGYMYP